MPPAVPTSPPVPPRDEPQPRAPEGGSRRRSPKVLWTGLIVVAILVGAGFLWRFPGVLEALVAAMEWLREAGWRGAFVYLLVHLSCSLLLVPASLIESGGGYAYGLLIGYPLTTLISLTDSTIAFLIGKYVLAPAFGGRFRKNLWFRTLDNVLVRQGTYAVVLLRLSPVAPFNVISYGLGFTRVRLRDVMIGTWLGSIPTLFFFVYLGSTLAHASELIEGSGTPLWAHIAGGVLTLAATTLITRSAQRAFKDALVQGEAALEDDEE